MTGCWQRLCLPPHLSIALDISAHLSPCCCHNLRSDIALPCLLLCLFITDPAAEIHLACPTRSTSAASCVMASMRLSLLPFPCQPLPIFLLNLLSPPYSQGPLQWTKEQRWQVCLGDGQG